MVVKWLARQLTELDIFGHKISVHYKGSETFKTKFGGAMTLVAYVLIIVQTSNLFSGFVSNSAQTEKFVSIKSDLQGQSDFGLEEHLFSLSIVDAFGGFVPEKYGEWKATLFYSEDQSYSNKTIPL